MRRWQPDVDLQRLLDALGEEILAATDEEMQRACGGAACLIALSARDVRSVIAAARGNQDGADCGATLAQAAGPRPHHLRPH